jgi:hypothetical protein
VVSVGFERLDLGVDQGHRFSSGEGEWVNRQELGYRLAGDKNNPLIASI